WCHAAADLRTRRRHAGLVVDDDVAAALALLDAVGARRQPQRVRADLDRQPAADLAIDGRERGTPLTLPAGEPARNALEARPPERLRLRIIVERCEARLAARQQFTLRIGRQRAAESLGELADRV